ncbi:MAG: HAD family hydrolase [Treponema sp.]|nr:HAD family hydrolase [Treponema sp.]
MRNGIEGVAFDLDGTLYPNYRLNYKLVPFILKELRLISAFGKARNIIRNEQKNGSAHNDFYGYQADLTAKLLSSQPELVREKIDRLIYKGWEPFFKDIKLYKMAVETLAGLQKAGYKMGLLSDFPPETKLDYLGLLDWGKGWDAVHCSERCGALKPHPLPFENLAAAMNLPCEKIIYVGNSHSYDVTGAQKAGMKTAWIKNPLVSGNKKPKPDFFFSNYRQLFDFMIN